MSRPGRVTACMPTYNRRSFLEQTLASAFAQTYRDFEILVGDDGSTDDTAAFLRSYPDSRLRLLSPHGKLGFPGIINALLNEARSELIAIFHDHDLYEPHFLEEAVKLLDRYPSAGFAFTGCHWIDDRGAYLTTHIPFDAEFLPRQRVFDRLVYHTDCPVVASAIVIRRELLERVGHFVPEFGLFGDVDLYIRLAALADAAYVLKPGIHVRVWNARDAITKATWRTISINRRIRLRGAAIASGGSPTFAARARIDAMYASQFVGQAAYHWLHGNPAALRTPIDEFDLSSVSPASLVLRALAATAPLGSVVGRALRVRRPPAAATP